MRSASTSKPAQPPECRFCLEPGTTEENPLIAPCPCKGSVRYVHWTCLKRWVRLDQANARACSICREPFNTSIFPGVVSVEGGPRAARLFLQHSYSASIALSYIALIWRVNGITAESAWTDCWQITRLGVISTHAIYAISFWLCWRELHARGRQAYWVATHRARLACMLAAHVYGLYEVTIGMPDEPDYIVLALMQLLLRLYWEQHKVALQRVNTALLRDFVEGA